MTSLIYHPSSLNHNHSSPFIFPHTPYPNNPSPWLKLLFLLIFVKDVNEQTPSLQKNTPPVPFRRLRREILLDLKFEADRPKIIRALVHKVAKQISECLGDQYQDAEDEHGKSFYRV